MEETRMGEEDAEEEVEEGVEEEEERNPFPARQGTRRNVSLPSGLWRRRRNESFHVGEWTPSRESWREGGRGRLVRRWGVVGTKGAEAGRAYSTPGKDEACFKVSRWSRAR